MDNFNYRRFGEQIDFVKAWIQERKRITVAISLAITALMITLIIQQVQISHLATMVRDVHSYHWYRAEAELNHTMGHVDFSNNLSARILQNSNEISILKTELKPKIEEHEDEIRGLDEFLEKGNENSDYFENSSIALKSCAEWREHGHVLAMHGKEKSGYYTIDVDGSQFGVEAMVVYCEFSDIALQLDKTIVKLNGPFEMPSLHQIEALIKYSSTCSQEIKVHGNGLPDSKRKRTIYWRDHLGTFLLSSTYVSVIIH